MESQLDIARNDYKSLIKQGETTTMSALPEFSVNDSFTLNQDEAWYSLAIETQVIYMYSTCTCVVYMYCTCTVQ